ncbi:MAG: phage tail protein [Billgrantia sp.]
MINENSTFGGFLTDIGEAKQANANALGIPWKLTHMLIGDANGTDPVPDPGQTQLVNQRYRAAINQLSVDPANPAILIAEVVLPPNIGGWWIRELAMEDEDGDFVAVANCPPSYKPLLAQGSGRNQVVRMHLILSNTANVQLKIDPSVVLATRKYVDDQRKAHEESREHPGATESAQGMIQRATNAQALSGTDNTRAMTPARVKGAIDDRIANQSTVDAGTDDAKFVTPKKLAAWVKAATESAAGMLKIAMQDDVDAGTDDTKAVTAKKIRWGVDYDLSRTGYIAFPTWLGGFIVQWGERGITYDGSREHTGSIAFPVAFPSQAFAILGSGCDITNNRYLVSVRASSRTTLTYNYRSLDTNPATSGSSLFNWIAVGR